MQIPKIQLFIVALLLFLAPINGFSATCSSEVITIDISQEIDYTKPKLTLDECISIALKNNPEITQKQLNIEVANAEKAIARSRTKPIVNMNFGYNHTIDNQALVKSRLVGDRKIPYVDDIFSGDFVLSMPIYTGNKLRNKIKSAELIKKSAKSFYQRSKSELVYNVSNTFYSMLGQKEVINSLNFSKKALDSHHKQVSEFLALQKAAKVDLLRTEVRLADIEQRLIREKNILNIQRSLLLNLLGITRDETKECIIDGALTMNEFAYGIDTAFKHALAHRQDYKALLHIVDAQRRTLRVAKAGRLPEVKLVGSYGNRWTGGHDSNSEEVGQIGIVANLPIFDGGSIRASIRRDRSKLKFKEEELRKLSLKIQLEVKAASLNIQSTKARIGVTQKAVVQAKESLRIEREKYDNGKGVIVDVLDAQSALLSSQTNYFRALADFNTATAQFKLASGEK